MKLVMGTKVIWADPTGSHQGAQAETKKEIQKRDSDFRNEKYACVNNLDDLVDELHATVKGYLVVHWKMAQEVLERLHHSDNLMSVILVTDNQTPQGVLDMSNKYEKIKHTTGNLNEIGAKLIQHMYDD